ncbi:MAG: hypothetical protein ACOYBS_05005 [Flavobacterium sp.]
MRGSAIGISIAHGLELVKNIFSSEKIASKLNPETTIGRFIQKSAGLSGAVNGLSGYIDAYGNYHEDGLGGYIDINGNYVENGLNAYDGGKVLSAHQEEGLNGYFDNAGNYHEDGLAGYIDVNGNYVEDGLRGYADLGLGANEEDGLGANIDENGNYIL